MGTVLLHIPKEQKRKRLDQPRESRRADYPHP